MRAFFRSLAAMAAAAAPALAQVQERFDGHRVVRVQVDDARGLRSVLALTDDVWTHEAGPGPLDVRMSPEQFAALQGLGLEHEVLIDDLQRRIDEEHARLAGGALPEASWFDDFKDNAAIVTRLNEHAANYPGLCQLSPIGVSLENRPMYALRVTGPGNSSQRPVVFIHGCQHAREWISPMTVMFYIEELLTKYSTDSRVKSVVDNVEFLFVPMSNPDGYQYTWDVNRMWRKNRRNNGGGCFGVDLNRNWGYQWGNNNGSSPDPCSDIYRGTAPFSEPETQNLRDFITPYQGRLKIHIDVHSYGQLVIYPWGYTTDPVPEPDKSTFEYVSDVIVDGIFDVHGMTYTPGQGSIVLYVVSGGSRDWSYGVLGAFGWTIELRDTGQTGFILPPAQIIPTGEEFTEALLRASEWVKNSAFTFSAAPPALVPTGVSTVFEVGVTVIGSGPVAGSEVLRWRPTGLGTFMSSALVSTGATTYEATLPSLTCGSSIEFYLEGESGSGAVVTLPSDGSYFEAEAADTEVLYGETFDPVGAGWTVGAAGDTATTGIWGIMDPEATAAQPGDDHTPSPGVNAYVTDGRAGTSVGTWDVDGGATTLTSPTISGVGTLSNATVVVEYWRWYSNDQGGGANQDTMPVRLSTDNGLTWTDLEVVSENANAWVRKEFEVGSPTAAMRLRFVARDDAPGSIVEAGVDDVRVMAKGCGVHPADCEGDGDLDVFDFLCFQGKFAIQDPYADFEKDGDWDLFDFLAYQNCYAGNC